MVKYLVVKKQHSSEKLYFSSFQVKPFSIDTFSTYYIARDQPAFSNHGDTKYHQMIFFEDVKNSMFISKLASAQYGGMYEL